MDEKSNHFQTFCLEKYGQIMTNKAQMDEKLRKETISGLFSERYGKMSKNLEIMKKRGQLMIIE
jgi:hypothetical protein